MVQCASTMLRRAISFLMGFVQEHPGNVDATHINMLAQLLIEQGRFFEALNAVEQAPTAEGGTPYPDIATKAGMCLLHLGRIDEGVQRLAPLLTETAVLYHDLYVAVRPCPKVKTCDAACARRKCGLQS